jgi:asparagine synthase (glutamine-hydrolysing)
MFAIALWDRQTQSLILARDRFGEKPLYYGRVNGSFIFASELKALRQFPDWQGRVDRDALASYLRFGYVPTPYSIYENIGKLPSGYYLRVSGNDQQLVQYWSAKTLAEQGIAKPLALSFNEAVDELDKQLRRTISEQSIADVPLGAFLSGGIDSSTVVALLQAQNRRPVKTFSIGFAEAGFDEAPFAKAVAEHLGTDHTELYVSAEQALAVVPKLPQIYDEPFADSSQIPTFLVSQLARKSVTVSLSGDAGDELFGGYNRYTLTPALWQKLNKLPYALRKPMGHLLRAGGLQHLQSLLPQQLKRFADKFDRIGHLLSEVKTETELYTALVSATTKPNQWVASGQEYPLIFSQAFAHQHFTEWMMLMDTVSYLPDDILVKVDRAGMAVSLESRIPFLDHRLYEFVWQLPLSYRLQGEQGKRILRDLLYRYVPKPLLDRPKMGFGIPLAAWLRGSLKAWASDLLAKDKLQQQGYFDADKVQTIWQAHLKGIANHQTLLWHMLMFNAWLTQGDL